MNFKKENTSTKLRWLATQLRRPKIAADFQQEWVDNCVVGLGARLTAKGTIGEVDATRDITSVFVDKFGVTDDEANALFIATYSDLEIDVEDYATVSDSGHRSYERVTAAVAAMVLDKLAEKYERKYQ